MIKYKAADISARLYYPVGPFKSYIHSGYFYSAYSSPLLLRGAPDTARILCRDFHTWRLERESNPLPFERKASTLPMRHHAPLMSGYRFPFFLLLILSL